MVISVEQVINRAKMRLRLNNTEHDAYLEKIINELALGLGSQRSRGPKCTTISIDCHRAKLPDNFLEFTGGKFVGDGCACGCRTNATGDELAIEELSTGSGNCSCPVWFVSRGVMSNFNGQGSCSVYTNYFDIEGNYIIFQPNITATEMKIYYQGDNTDCDGLMIIFSQWERGLSAGAAAEFALDYDEMYSPRKQQYWNKLWTNQKGHIIGAENIARFNLDSHDIERMMNSIISNTSLQGVYNIPFNN